MPYQSLAQLPKTVRDNLPKHAQQIYKAAFNNAWQEYADAKKRHNNTDHESTAHRVAWAAVEAKYQKAQDGHWQEK